MIAHLSRVLDQDFMSEDEVITWACFRWMMSLWNQSSDGTFTSFFPKKPATSALIKHSMYVSMQGTQFLKPGKNTCSWCRPATVCDCKAATVFLSWFCWERWASCKDGGPAYWGQGTRNNRRTSARLLMDLHSYPGRNCHIWSCSICSCWASLKAH